METTIIKISDITILPELETFLPPVDVIAAEKLIEDIKSHGIREPLSVTEYEGKTILLDGHNRLGVAKKLKIADLPAVFYPMATLTDAKQFILNNQLAKRNLSTKERILMVLQLEPELAAQAQARKKMTAEEVQKSAPPAGKVVEQLAKLAGKSRDTIAKIKLIQQHGTAELLELTDTELSINQAATIAKLPKREQKAAIDVVLKKPVVQKPNNKRDYKPISFRFQNNQIIISSDYLTFNIDLTTETDEEKAKKINEAADFFTQLGNELKKTAIFYTPKKP